MIIWLASYPRSGNTLLRLILHRGFGHTTWSLYDDKFDLGRNDAAGKAIGHRLHGKSPAAFLAEARASKDTYIVKTHEMPPADQGEKVIYVVRDGRAAVVSYWHYRRRIADCRDELLEETVAGTVWGGLWSRHVDAWIDAPIEKKLVLRYESLVSDLPGNVAELAGFLECPTPPSPDTSFGPLQDSFPEFFHRGDNAANVRELEARCPGLFNALHGTTQSRLGYPTAVLRDADPRQGVSDELKRAFATLRAARPAAPEPASAQAPSALSGKRRSALWRWLGRR